MKFSLSRILIACALALTLAEAGAKQPPLKRDAGLSFGSVYHGPSHKYLPPPSVSYDGGYSALHGNGLAASSGFDFGSLDSDSHQHQHHHYAPQHQHQPRPIYSSYHHHQAQAPKVETYIVQTSGHGHGHGHGPAAAGYNYKYAPHGGSSGSSGSFLDLLGAQKLHSGGGGGGGSYLHHSVPDFGYSGHHSSLSSGRPSFVPVSQNHGHGHGHAHIQSLGHGLSLSHAPLDLSSLSHGHGGVSSSSGYHYAHELEQQLGSGVGHVEEPAGYSYDAPSHSFGKPLTSSYGVPLLPAYEQEHKQLTTTTSHEEQPPAYALGHKGLGHFTYTASRPHALHTDIISHQSNHQQEHNELPSEISKAPFKPSVFLGAKHESSDGGSGQEASGYEYATPSTQYLQPPTSSGYDYQPPSLLYGAPSHSGDSATPIFEPEATYLPPVTAPAAPQLSYGAPSSGSNGYHH